MGLAEGPTLGALDNMLGVLAGFQVGSRVSMPFGCSVDDFDDTADGFNDGSMEGAFVTGDIEGKTVGIAVSFNNGRIRKNQF